MKQISSHRAGGESGYSQYRSGPYEKCDRSTARAVRNNLRVKKLTGSAFSYTACRQNLGPSSFSGSWLPGAEREAVEFVARVQFLMLRSRESRIAGFPIEEHIGTNLGHFQKFNKNRWDGSTPGRR